MNLKNKLLTRSKKFFSSKADNDKEKKLNQFFKLPKTKLDFQDKVFDRPDEEYSVMNSYDEIDLDRMDMMDKIIKKKKLESNTAVNKFFENTSGREKVKITENLIEKMRMNKEFKFTDDYKQKQIFNEYGNYDKYFSNYKVTKEKKYDSDDDGENLWTHRYNELQEKYKNPGTGKNWQEENQTLEEKIKEDMTTYGSNYSFINYLQTKKEHELRTKIVTTNPRTSDMTYHDMLEKAENDLQASESEKPYDKQYRSRKERKWENKNTLFDQVSEDIDRAGFDIDKELEKENSDLAEYYNKTAGRVSPWAKEEIYQNYLEGWTVKDLSYKFGLLPERVKVIIWMRDIFWKEIYPKIGESELRRRLEEGLEYARSEYYYVDYGKDLREMALREQGVYLRKVPRSEIDCKPTKEIQEKVSAVLKNVKPKSTDYIPVKFYGKGPSGYLIKEIFMRRKKGSKRVSYMFRKFCYYKDLHPNLLPDKVLVRKDLGPRLATLGYKF